MTPNVQTTIAFICVGLALIALIRRFFFKKEKHGEGCCSCPTDQFKAKLKR